MAQQQAPVQTPEQVPQIYKIDPPDWFAGLPDPMLLVQGEGLNGARFAVTGSGVGLDRSQVSENGHWAFLWLTAKAAAPQTLWITASNKRGQVRHSWVLAERSHDPRAHAGFSSADAMYLIMTDRFSKDGAVTPEEQKQRQLPRGWHGGELAGIEQHLDYLKQLGITTLWTTPVASNGAMPDSYHGYAATDLYAVDPHFGTLDEYRHLSRSLHAQGMKLVIDLVPNHLGVQHPWILDPPAPSWLHGTLTKHLGAHYDFQQIVDPHAARQANINITDGWFTDAMPDLNQENPLVSRYLIQNALWWVETANLDGIRLDTFPFVGRTFWRDFHSALHQAYPHLTTVGEVFNRDPEVTSFFAGGVARRGIDTGMDTPFDFPVFYTLRDILAHDKPMTDLPRVLGQDALYPHPERLVLFIGNHDTTRFLTEANGSVPALRLALGLLTTLRGMPLIYSGDEIAMTGGEDPDNRHDFPGGFAGDTHNAFTDAGRTPTEESVFNWTSSLLTLRAAHPALQAGIQQDLFANEDLYVFLRGMDESGCLPDHSALATRERLLIVVNKAKSSKSLDLAMENTALAGCSSFQALAPALGTAPPVESGAKLHIEEAPESFTIYAVR